jgi:hypothetical protein
MVGARMDLAGASGPGTQHLVRDVLKTIEVTGRFSASSAAAEARVQWGLDCLLAIPAKIFEDRLLPAEFYEKRWPQIRKMVSAGVARRQGGTP